MFNQLHLKAPYFKQWGIFKNSDPVFFNPKIRVQTLRNKWGIFGQFLEQPSMIINKIGRSATFFKGWGIPGKWRA
jgi:hypothetical protein